MALLEVAKLGNPILRQMASPVSHEVCQQASFQQFVDDMIETMHHLDGVGLAAPQVFVSKQVIVIGSDQNPRYPNAPYLSQRVILNPTFIPLSEEKGEGWEGCLSLDNLRGRVIRWVHLRVKGYDRYMVPLEFDTAGFLSIVVQHETDHLIGRLFIDRMNDFSTLSHLAEYEQYWVPRPAAVA